MIICHDYHRHGAYPYTICIPSLSNQLLQMMSLKHTSLSLVLLIGGFTADFVIQSLIGKVLDKGIWCWCFDVDLPLHRPALTIITFTLPSLQRADHVNC